MTYWSTPPTVVTDTVAASSVFNDLSALVNFLGNPPMGRLYVSTEFGIPSGEWTDVPMDRTDYLQNGMTNDSNAFVVPTSGLYTVGGQVQYAGFSGNPTLVMVGLYTADNGTVVRISTAMGATEGQGPAPGAKWDVYLAEGDQVKLQAWHNSAYTELCTGAEPGASNYCEIKWAANYS
jgi:hypothetical protein